MRLLLAALLLLFPLAAGAAEPAATIKVEKGKADFFLGEELVATYHFGPDVAKPYFWPVNAPGQIAVTRGWPMAKGLPKETTDHVHQKSAWFCHGDVIPEGVAVVPSSDKKVRGVDFWSETKGHGKIVCVKADSFGEASLITRNEWTDSAGTKIMDETRTISVHAVSKGHLIVLDIDLEASVCPLTFGDTKEGSMGVRVSDEIQSKAKNPTAALTNSSGRRDEKEVWGMLADWCDYSGEIGGKHAGIAVFDAPANPSRAAWHSRGYGLVAANPFGRAVAGFPARKGASDLVKLAKGAHLKLRYAMFLHAGDAKSGRVAEAFEVFTKMK